MLNLPQKHIQVLGLICAQEMQFPTLTGQSAKCPGRLLAYPCFECILQCKAKQDTWVLKLNQIDALETLGSQPIFRATGISQQTSVCILKDRASVSQSGPRVPKRSCCHS